MLLGGLLGMGGNLLLYINGLALTGPIDAFVIRTVQPIIVIALSIIFLHANFTKYKALGIILGLGGALYASLMGRYSRFSIFRILFLFFNSDKTLYREI